MNAEKFFKNIRKKHKNEKIIFCSGSFDLLHPGHVEFFETCKKFGDILVVTVGSDDSLRKNKGPGRPVLSQKARYTMVNALKVVDYTLLETDVKNGNLLNHLSRSFKYLRPDIYVVNEDAFDLPYRLKLVKKFNVKMEILKRKAPRGIPNISTTGIINKIKESKIK